MLRHPRRAPVVAALVALTLTGCGSTVAHTGASAAGLTGGSANGQGLTPADGSGTDVAAGSTGSAASGPTAAGLSGTGGGTGNVGTGTSTSVTGGGGLSGGDATGGSIAVSGDHQGITATTIKVGFIGIDSASQAETNTLFGASSPPADTQNAMKAIVAYVNSHGGIDGRKIIPVYVERQTSSTDPNADHALCTSLTEDAHVFAVVTNSAHDEEPCYAKHHTLLLDDTLVSQHDLLSKLSPYVWSPGLTSDEAGYAALVDSLGAQRYFAAADAKVGIVGYDDPPTHFTFDKVLKPRFAAIGFPLSKVHIEFISQPQSDADNAKWAQDIQGTVLHFRSEGINRVFFMAPGAGVPIIFMNQAESQQYHPIYGLSSYDSPGFLLQGKMPNDQLHGSMGAGFNEITDVDAQRGDPFPSGVAEQRCLSILRASGQTPANRGAAFGAMYLCDGAFLLQQAAQGSGAALSVQTWAKSAEQLGSRFQATYSLPGGTLFDKALHFGSAYYRWLKFNDGCSCFEYASKNKPIPRQPL